MRCFLWNLRDSCIEKKHTGRHLTGPFFLCWTSHWTLTLGVPLSVSKFTLYMKWDWTNTEDISYSTMKHNSHHTSQRPQQLPLFQCQNKDFRVICVLISRVSLNSSQMLFGLLHICLQCCAIWMSLCCLMWRRYCRCTQFCNIKSTAHYTQDLKKPDIQAKNILLRGWFRNN